MPRDSRGQQLRKSLCLAIGLGISTVPGGNVVAMGEEVRRRLAAIKPDQPLGIEIGHGASWDAAH